MPGCKALLVAGWTAYHARPHGRQAALAKATPSLTYTLTQLFLHTVVPVFIAVGAERQGTLPYLGLKGAACGLAGFPALPA